MAENFSDEGLDRILSLVPAGNGYPDTTLYMAILTTSGTVDGVVNLDGSKVPNRLTVWASDYSVSGGAGRGGGGEPIINTGGYVRKSIANSIWGNSPASSGSGRRLTGAQQSMPTSQAPWSPTVTCGVAIVTALNAGAGIAYFYSNYSDGSLVTVNAQGIILQLTPFWEIDI